MGEREKEKENKGERDETSTLNKEHENYGKSMHSVVHPNRLGSLLNMSFLGSIPEILKPGARAGAGVPAF